MKRRERRLLAVLAVPAFATAAFALDGCRGENGASAGGDDEVIEVPEGWERVETPPDVYLSNLWVSPSGAAYFTARQDTDADTDLVGIQRFDGTSWSLIPSPLLVPFIDENKSIWGRSNSDIYVGTSNGTILHYDGASWTTVHSPSWFHDVWVAENGAAYIVGYKQALLYSGGAWTDISDSRMESVVAVWGCEENDVRALSIGDDAMSVFQWNGELWQEFDADFPQQPYLTDIWGVPCGDLYATSGNSALRFDGETWSEEEIVAGDETYTFVISGIGGTISSAVYAVGWVEAIIPEDTDKSADFYEEGVIFARSDTGWTPIYSDLPPLTGIWGFDTNEMVLLGENNEIFFFDGTDVEELYVPDLPYRFDGVWGLTPNDFYAFGSDGQLQHFNGTAWETLDSGTNTNLLSMGGNASGLKMAIGWYGTVTLADGDGPWTELLGDHCRGLTELNGDENNVYGFGNGWGSLTRFDGTDWEAWEIPVYDSESLVTDIWPSGAGDIVVTAWDYGDNGSPHAGEIARFTDDAWSLMSIPIDDAISWTTEGIESFPSGEITAVGFWEPYQLRASGLALRYDGIDWNVDYDIADDLLIDLWGSAPDDIYAIGSENALTHFDGSSWKTQYLATSRLLEIDGSGPDNIYVLGSYLLHKTSP